MEYAFKTLQEKHTGIIIDGERLYHLRFADNIILQNENTKIDLTIIYNRTKIMTNLIPDQLLNEYNKDI